MRGLAKSLVAVLGFSLMAVGCTRNPCEDVQCVNNGTCREGRCACPTGYEGVFCEFKASDKFIGDYNGFSSANEDQPDYREFIVVGSADPKELRIYDRNSPNQYFKAKIEDNVKITIDYQQAGVASGYWIQGRGVLEKSKYLKMWLETIDPFGVRTNEYYAGTKASL
ncbi:MAG: EGF-like domain [Bacteroidota bacterium]